MAIEKQIDLEEVISGVPMPDGTEEVEVELTDEAELEAAEAMGLLEDEDMMEDEFDANLAELIPEEDLQLVANDLIDGYERDKESRSDYDNIAEEGVTLLGFTDEQGDEPFPGACGATHPVLAQAVAKFRIKRNRTN